MDVVARANPPSQKKLNAVLRLKIIHLDQYFWQPNWVEMKKTKWEQTVTNLASEPEWIIDGNYGLTIDIRIQRADAIIFLDFSTIKCLWRIMKRVLKYRGKVRPDMPKGCKERFDLGLYHYVLTYNMLRRQSILKKLEKLKDKKHIEILKNDSEQNDILMKLS